MVFPLLIGNPVIVATFIGLWYECILVYDLSVEYVAGPGTLSFFIGFYSPLPADLDIET